MLRLARYFALLGLMVLIAACTVRLPWTPSPLATVGADGNVYILEGERRTPITADSVRYRHPVWSRDGRLLAFLGEDKTTIFMASATGEWVREVYRSEDERARTLGWSPDGQTLAFTTNSASAGISLLHLISAQTGDLRTLDAGADLRWRWTRDGHLMIRAGDRQTLLTVEGRVLDERFDIHAPPKLAGMAVPSPNGQRAAVFVPQADGSFLLSIINAHTGLEIGRFTVRLTPEYWELIQSLVEWQEGLRIWSPNGHYVAVAQVDGEESGLWAYPAAGNEAPRRLGDGVEVSWFWR
ncbi:MAG: PD40 domain-containing protein [Caldilineaceae bacterium]|nr:PD40 domain-containing protein [Caldilineaceae bacterium]